jgi:HAD superfamily hydrolase (TIGR01484 family)
MRILALACDYDGTLATHGIVDRATVEALARFRESGRKLILVTGRELPELIAIFDVIDLFEWVVAENGALLYHPATKKEKPLAAAPDEQFVAQLRARGVAPCSVGRVIVATWQPHETTVLATIRDLGLEMQVIFNKGAVMVLPSGVNKATGLAAALYEMKMSAHNVAGIGDAENDHALVACCEVGAAVANSVAMLKQHADWVASDSHGAGVRQLIDRLLADDCADVQLAIDRHDILLGHERNGTEFRLSASGSNVLVAGNLESGEPSASSTIVERLVDRGYQVCVLDPEGDYEGFENCIPIGSATQAPTLEAVLKVLEAPNQSVIVNLFGLGREDQRLFTERLLRALDELRKRKGRPHWLVINDEEQLWPATHRDTQAIQRGLESTMLVTLKPQELSRELLAEMNLFVIEGQTAEETAKSIAAKIGWKASLSEFIPSRDGEVVAFQSEQRAGLKLLKLAPSRYHRRRRMQRLVHGELEPANSFYFRGPEGKSRLRAQNLTVFLQLLEGVDDESWLFHLHQRDYSRWFRDALKDIELADVIGTLEESGLGAAESRRRIRERILEHYSENLIPARQV